MQRQSALGTALLFLACAAPAPEPPRAPAPAEHQHEHAAPLPASAGPGYTIADVHFMQHMIGHHAQALTMAAMVPANTTTEAVHRLAQKIDISQRDEIALMRQWLEQRDQAVPDETQAHAMMMPGMLTPEQLGRLRAARGPEFDRLFLTFMIRHHEGALTMVEDLFAQRGAGQDPDVFRFATDVDADQRDEIFAMQRLLDTLSQESQ